MHSMSNDSIEEIEEESTLFSTFNNDPIAIQDQSTVKNKTSPR